MAWRLKRLEPLLELAYISDLMHAVRRSTKVQFFSMTLCKNEQVARKVAERKMKADVTLTPKNQHKLQSESMVIACTCNYLIDALPLAE